MDAERFSCPRRSESWIGRTGDELPDSWLPGRGLVNQLRGCSYCGSMPPEDFMQRVRDGAQIGPTDKSYKLYVGDSEAKFYTKHLSEQQGWDFYQLWKDGLVHWGYPGYPYVPLYLPGPSENGRPRAG